MKPAFAALMAAALATTLAAGCVSGPPKNNPWAARKASENGIREARAQADLRARQQRETNAQYYEPALAEEYATQARKNHNAY